MSEPVSLDQIKADLRLDPSATDEDAQLTRYLVAARRMVELRTGRRFAGLGADLVGDDGLVGGMAISTIVAHWYANPEAVSADARTTPTELPLSAGWMIEALKRWDDGSC